MRKNLYRLLSTVFLLALPATALADTSVDSATIFRFYQDDRPGFGEKDLKPATQFLGLDVDNLGDGNLSLHLYGWGRLDLDEKSFNNKEADGSLTYGYLQYRFKQANARARAGRFFVSEGIVNEQVDGLSVRTDLPLGFGISAFGGATVHTVHMPGESTDGKGDGIVGGRMNYRYKGLLELGVSGVYESEAPGLVTVPTVNGQAAFGSRRLVGGDIWLNPHRMVEIIGHSSYNTETRGVAEHGYLLNVKPLKNLALTGEFNEYRDRSLFFSSIFFAKLLDNLNDRSRTLGGRATYELNKTVEISGDFKHYTREVGKADRFGGDVRFTLLKNSLRSGIAYHYLRASRDFAITPTASGSFHEARAYAMYDSKGYFAALDTIGYFFKEKINSENSAWEVSGSLGYRVTPALALSGDLSYGKNPQFVDDLKGLVRLTYNMNYAAKGGTK
jgi:hypothetical protein